MQKIVNAIDSVKVYRSWRREFGPFKKPKKLKPESIGGCSGECVIDKKAMTAEQMALWEEFKDDLYDKVRHVPARSRKAIDIYFFCGHTLRVGGQLMRISRERFRQLLVRGIRKLKDEYEEEEDDIMTACQSPSKHSMPSTSESGGGLTPTPTN